MAKLEREIPWCTIILVAGALISHTLVLLGNLETAAMFSTMGQSTAGWSTVGTSLSDAMATELDVLMSDATDVLTTSLDKVQEVQELVDYVFGLAGSVAEDILSHYSTVTAAVALNSYDASLLQGTAIQSKWLQPEVTGLTQLTLSTNPQAVATRRVVLARQKQLEMRQARALARTYGDASFIQAKREGTLRVGNITDLMEAAEAIIDSIWDNITNGTGIAPPIDELEDKLEVALTSGVNTILSELVALFDEFIDVIRPALEQIGVWVTGFSDSMQAALEGFSSTLDKVQKIFDQVMASLSSSVGEGEEDIVFDTYALFDLDGVGFITASDVTTVADLYGITVLSEDKVAELFSTYDTEGDGKITIEEYALMMNDPSLSDIMPVMLRTYSKLLSQIGGNVAAAVMRDEVASAVVDYFTLVCAKNLTKVGWVSTMLVNHTLPLAFTHDILVNLANNKDNPNALTDKDVGMIVVNMMAWLGPGETSRAVLLMTDPINWETEGYLAKDQAPTIKQVVTWVVEANNTEAVMAEWPEPFSTMDQALLPDAFANFTQARSDAYQAEIKANTTDISDAYYSTGSATALADALLGGVAASAANSDATQLAAVNNGVPAVPATLLFAQWLSWNATDQSAIYEAECFNYTATSSSQLDNFVDQVQEMVAKMQAFLTNMEYYAGDAGIQQMEDFAAQFAEEAGNDVVNILMSYLSTALQELNATLSTPQGAKMALIQKAHIRRQDPTTVIDNAESVVSGVVDQIITLLTGLQLQLPAVIDDLKFARTEVSAVAETLDTVFSTFQESGPPIFETIAMAYSTLWTAYFIFFALLTTSVLFYGFWASGWFGGSKPSEEDTYEAPQTCMDRLRCCCNSCMACVRGCHDSNLCFWSFVILLEVIVFVLFIVSIVLCLLAGIKAFVSAGCTTVYVLNDNTICQGVLGLLQGWLTTFWADIGDLTSACDNSNLLTCELITQRTKHAVTYTILGSLVAAVLSFQMIIESAIMHERARWRKIFDDEAKIQ